MQKCINFFLAISIIFLSLLTNNLSAQSLSYELIGNYDSVEDVTYTIKFTPYPPDGYVFCRLEFDVVPDETIAAEEVYVFTTTLEVINVTLYYTLAGGDCTAAVSQIIPIYPRRAHFTENLDSQLDSIGSLKRILRSSLQIEDNVLHENLRFFWSFDEKMIPKPEVDFDINDLSLGQYPNVYYTFPKGGAYEITLKVADINSNNTASFTRIVEFRPDESDLLNFERIPNVFTPNETSNNFFEVQPSGTSNLSFKVFSRSGALVYEYKGSVIRWDGKNYYGNDLPHGIYYYLIEDIGAQKKYNTAKGFFYIYR